MNYCPLHVTYTYLFLYRYAVIFPNGLSRTWHNEDQCTFCEIKKKFGILDGSSWLIDNYVDYSSRIEEIRTTKTYPQLLAMFVMNMGQWDTKTYESLADLAGEPKLRGGFWHGVQRGLR